MQVEQDDNRGPQLRATAVSFLALAWIGVVMRVFTRALIVRKILWDDGFVVMSLVFYSMYNSFVLVGEHYGTGQHDRDLSSEGKLVALRYWYYCEWSYVITMTFVKVAIGILYLRIFFERWQRRVVWIIIAVVILTGVAYMSAVVFQCIPVPFIWHRYSNSPQINGKCLPKAIVLTGSYLHSAVSALSDFALAGLPVILLWGMRMAFWKKFWIVFMMSIGAIAVVATVIRLKFLESLVVRDDFLFATLDVAIWSTVEPGVAIFAVSLSALRPLLGLLMNQTAMQVFKSKLATVSWRVDLSPSREEGNYAELNEVQYPAQPQRARIPDRDGEFVLASALSNTAARSSIRVWHDPSGECRESTQGIIKTTVWTSTTLNLELDRAMTEPRLHLDPMSIRLEDMPDLVFRT